MVVPTPTHIKMLILACWNLIVSNLFGEFSQLCLYLFRIKVIQVQIERKVRYILIVCSWVGLQIIVLVLSENGQAEAKVEIFKC